MASNGHIGPWIATSDGGKIYPFGPRPEDFSIDVIAHSLAYQCRYNGHTSEFWSVASHSVVMSEMMEEAGFDRTMQLTALLHDASECALTDIPRPIKPMMLNYKLWEENIEATIAERYGTVFPLPDPVKRFDDAMVHHEVFSFFPPGSAAWKRYDIHWNDPLIKLQSRSPEQSREDFLLRYTELKVES